MNWLNKLRPAKGATAAALRAKLTETEVQAAALAARVADMERQRGPLLLDGTPAEVKAGEAALAAARDEAAAVSAMAATLAERAAEAEGAEKLAEYRAEVAAVQAEAAQLAEWFRARLPVLAAEIRTIAAREGEVCDRLTAVVFRGIALAEAQPEARDIPAPVEPFTAAGGTGRFASMLRLPMPQAGGGQ
jgi:hypothetical protein